MDDVDTNKILVISEEFICATRNSKFFVSYQNTKKIRP